MKNIKTVLSAFALVLCITACGKKGGGSAAPAAAPAATDVYAQCGNNQQCINQYFSQQMGPNQNGYYQGNQSCGGGYQCGVYQVPNYQNGCNQGCGTQQYVSVPPGAYMPQQGIYGQGGSYYRPNRNQNYVSFGFGWN